MKILYVGKYPPIEGGVSSSNYWLIRGLAKRGHHVSVVTNAGCVEEDRREALDLTDPKESSSYIPEGVRLFSLQTDPPKHIPFSQAYLSRLVNLGLVAAEKEFPDVIYTHYLEPYAVAGFMLKAFLKVPHITRHAGSDIYRFLQSDQFKFLLARVIKDADRLIFSKAIRPFLDGMAIPEQKIFHLTRALDPEAFTPHGDHFDFASHGFSIPSSIPLITYVGKASKNKGLEELFTALEKRSEDFRLVLVSKGQTLDSLFERRDEFPTVLSKTIGLGFVPPWKIPSILRASSLLVQLENDFPVPIHGPLQPIEGIACGTPLFLSGEMLNKTRYSFPDSYKNILTVDDPKHPREMEKALDSFFSTPAHVLRERAFLLQREFEEKNDWKKYLDSFSELLSSASRRRLPFF